MLVKSIPQYIPHIPTGVSYMTALIASLVAAAISGGLGVWYGKRGAAGMTTDVNTLKADVTALKAKVGA